MLVTQTEVGKTYGIYKPDRGHKFVAVYFTISRLTGQGARANSNQSLSYIIDEKGNSYGPMPDVVILKTPQLRTVAEIPEKYETGGWITFHVPIEAKGLIFTYDLLPGHADYHFEWRLGL